MASKPGGRGGKKKFTSKGGHKHFSDFEELKKQNEEIKREKAMQRAQEEEESDEDAEKDPKLKTAEKPKVVDFDKKLTTTKKSGKKNRDDSGSASSSEGGESSSEGADDESDDGKGKGVQHLIDIENPNRQVQKMKKLKDLTLDDTGPTANPVAGAAAAAGSEQQLSRKEREALEAERKKQEYQRLHALGKTEQAQADLARLAIIKKQREDAAKKREEEKKAKEEAELKMAKDKLAGKH